MTANLPVGSEWSPGRGLGHYGALVAACGRALQEAADFSTGLDDRGPGRDCYVSAEPTRTRRPTDATRTEGPCRKTRRPALTIAARSRTPTRTAGSTNTATPSTATP